MDYSSCIEQKGVIDHFEDGIAKVRITSFSACAHCHNKASCGVSDSSEKILEVPANKSDFALGETVQVAMQRTLGLKAALIAYVLPFVIVLLFLIVMNTLKISELWAGLLSIAILVPYFLGLYYFRGRLNKTFTFTIHKVN